jgi:hypothetical protein
MFLLVNNEEVSFTYCRFYFLGEPTTFDYMMGLEG